MSEKFKEIGVSFHAGLTDAFEAVFNKTEMPSCLDSYSRWSHDRISKKKIISWKICLRKAYITKTVLSTIGQNLFVQGKNSVTMRRNIQYYTLYISDNRMNRLEAYMQRMIRVTNTRPAKTFWTNNWKYNNSLFGNKNFKRKPPLMMWGTRTNTRKLKSVS